MDFIIQRLREPSTFAGIAAFLASFGLLGLTEQDWNQIFAAVAAIAAAAAIFVSEKPSESSDENAPQSQPTGDQ